jgi:alkaline phosphatase D
VCRLTPAELRADFHTLPYVSKRNAPSTVTASFTVADGAHQLSGSPAPTSRQQQAAVAEGPR